MTTIQELATKYIRNYDIDEWSQEVIHEWMKAARCGEIDARVVVYKKDNLNKVELEQRKTIKEETVAFIRRYFDNRPDVMRILDALFETFGLSNTKLRRMEFFPFSKIYTLDELNVLLLKRLQPAPNKDGQSRETIAKYFVTTEKTINKYLGTLLPAANLEQSAKVLGQAVQANPTWRTNVPESTTHPILLPLSMVELYTLVDMLVEHSDNEVEGRIVQLILGRVLNQTTDYADERLARIAGFNKALSSAQQNKQHALGEAVLFSEKERIRARVRYEQDGIENTCTGYISRNYEDKTLIDIVENDKLTQIPFKNIIKLESANKKES